MASNQHLQLWTRSLDRVAHVELLEVLDEQAGQCFGGFVVGGFVSPGVAWVQQASLNARYGQWHVEVDGVQVLGLGADQRAALDRCLLYTSPSPRD